MAARSNHTPDEVAYDHLAGGAERFLFFPIVGYNEDNLDIIHMILTDVQRSSDCPTAARIVPPSSMRVSQVGC